MHVHKFVKQTHLDWHTSLYIIQALLESKYSVSNASPLMSIIMLYGLNTEQLESMWIMCILSKCGKCHTVLDDYSALAIICMLLLLTAV